MLRRRDGERDAVPVRPDRPVDGSTGPGERDLAAKYQKWAADPKRVEQARARLLATGFQPAPVVDLTKEFGLRNARPVRQRDRTEVVKSMTPLQAVVTDDIRQYEVWRDEQFKWMTLPYFEAMPGIQGSPDRPRQAEGRPPARQLPPAGDDESQNRPNPDPAADRPAADRRSDPPARFPKRREAAGNARRDQTAHPGRSGHGEGVRVLGQGRRRHAARGQPPPRRRPPEPVLRNHDPEVTPSPRTLRGCYQTAMRLPTITRYFGVDFSGAKLAGRNTWIAECLASGGRKPPVEPAAFGFNRGLTPPARLGLLALSGIPRRHGRTRAGPRAPRHARPGIPLPPRGASTSRSACRSNCSRTAFRWAEQFAFLARVGRGRLRVRAGMRPPGAARSAAGCTSAGTPTPTRRRRSTATTTGSSTRPSTACGTCSARCAARRGRRCCRSSTAGCRGASGWWSSRCPASMLKRARPAAPELQAAGRRAADPRSGAGPGGPSWPASTTRRDSGRPHRRVIMRNPGGDALDAVIAAVGASRAFRPSTTPPSPGTRATGGKATFTCDFPLDPIARSGMAPAGGNPMRRSVCCILRGDRSVPAACRRWLSQSRIANRE